jgi:hypothetical protein
MNGIFKGVGDGVAKRRESLLCRVRGCLA